MIFPEPHHKLGQINNKSWAYEIMTHCIRESNLINTDKQATIEKIQTDKSLNDHFQKIHEIFRYRESEKLKVLSDLADIVLWHETQSKRLYCAYNRINVQFGMNFANLEQFLTHHYNFIVEHSKPENVGFFSMRGKLWEKFTDWLYEQFKVLPDASDNQIRRMAERRVLEICKRTRGMSEKVYRVPEGQFEGKAFVFTDELPMIESGKGIAPWLL